MEPSGSRRDRSKGFHGDGPDEQSLFYPGSKSTPGPGPGPGPSALSVKSDSSKNILVEFRAEHQEEQSPFGPGPGPGPSCLSVKSDSSKNIIVEFKEEHSEEQRDPGPQEPLDDILRRLKEDVLTFVQEQLQMICRLLASDYPECSEQNSREVLNITMDRLRGMKQEKLVQRLERRSAVGVFRDELKKHLQQKVSRVFEGVAKAGDSTPLTQIYTELHITEGGASEVNQEHEVRLMETVPRRPSAPETIITCEDLFKPRPHSPQPIRALLMKGVAGVGKTVLTQKVSLDWAEGRAHQDLQLLFPFSFRELNVLKDRSFSLVGLIQHFFSPTKGLCSFEDLQVLLIFDGLDECRLPLDFSSPKVSDPKESVSLDLLLVNLIRGSLLPSTRLWITTRPAAANRIPEECVSMVTEVRGFTDLQKKEYFRKKFRDKRQAKKIISHIKSVRSLHIMCHIPVFCWILSTVLQKLLEHTEEPELPRTLTQMYSHFLVVHAKVQKIKFQQGSGAEFHWTPETGDMVKSLGKLAFEQLQRGNLIFYDSDLSECGLDAAAASLYSGVFTQVFREEPGLYQDKVYCFIHLSVQEFLAALHVHQTFYSSGANLLKIPDSSENLLKTPHSSETKGHFYRSAVDQALQSPNGHLDLFLRFLLGLSLPTNQRLLSGLLTQTESNTRIVKYIKDELNEKGLSAERSMNLLHCLMELNDHSLVERIQKYMRKGEFSWIRFPGQWSALSFVLLSSDSDLQDFDLRKYLASETALLGLLPVVRASTKALLRGCGLSSRSCGHLASVLSSSSLTHLDLSNNDLQDSGVELLCSGLKSAPCRLHALMLSGCLISERGGAALASALSPAPSHPSPAPSHLKELDLSYNHPGSSSELLKALLDDPHCPLVELRLDPAGEQWMVPGLRKYSCEFSLDPNTAHRDLTLSEDNRTATKDREEPHSPDPEEGVPEVTEEVQNQSRVLSSSGLRGRRYWEVDWSGWRGIDIAVSRRGRGERGEERGGRSEERGERREERGERREERGERREERGESEERGERSEKRGESEERGERGESEERREGSEDRGEGKERVDHKERGDRDERGERSKKRGDSEERGDHEARGDGVEGGDSKKRGESEERGEDEERREIKERGERTEERGDREETGDIEELGFGDDRRSWSLRVCYGSYSFYHNSKRTVLRPLPSSFTPSGRVAVFLDSEAGSLSFYHVTCHGDLLHLHTCTSSFSEPVFPGFGLRSEGDSVSVVDLSRAPPAGSE